MKNNYSFQKNILRRVTYFYIFANLFNAWLNRKQLYSYLLLHSICCNLLFWLKYAKKIQPHTEM